MKNWYSIENKHSEVIDISIHDEIGMFGISAAEFISDLRSHSEVKSINLSIHSPGGNVLDGLAMYNALKSHPAKVFGHVEGIAASAASFILMASDQISMPEDAFIMIHNAHGGVMGDAEDMRDMADIVEKLQNSIVNIYEKRVSASREDIEQMMKVETWLNSEEAIKHGFADTISDAIDLAAKTELFDKHFKTMPFNKKIEKIDVDSIETITDYENTLRDSGLSKRLAQALTSRAKQILRSEPVTDDGAFSEITRALDKVGYNEKSI